MLSSYANFDKTYFYGNTFDFGDFDRCLNINELLLGKTDNNASDVIKGKHCMVQYLTRRRDVIAIPPCKVLMNHNIRKKFINQLCKLEFFNDIVFFSGQHVQSRLEKH